MSGNKKSKNFSTFLLQEQCRLITRQIALVLSTPSVAMHGLSADCIQDGVQNSAQLPVKGRAWHLNRVKRVPG
jgi:hypothetical protein